MNETRVFKDSYRGVFLNQEDFLDCLKRIGKNSFWDRKKSKNLRLVAITEESQIAKDLKEQYAKEGLAGKIGRIYELKKIDESEARIVEVK